LKVEGLEVADLTEGVMELKGRAAGMLRFIVEYREQRQISPTYREIGEACRISTTSLVRYHLDKLEMMGYIRRLRGVPRGIIPVKDEG
jgi:repressor LexA